VRQGDTEGPREKGEPAILFKVGKEWEKIPTPPDKKRVEPGGGNKLRNVPQAEASGEELLETSVIKVESV